MEHANQTFFNKKKQLHNFAVHFMQCHTVLSTAILMIGMPLLLLAGVSLFAAITYLPISLLCG